ncbi:MAG: hypothetical protein AAF678_06030 [Pseudomonadota bacterium]
MYNLIMYAVVGAALYMTLFGGPGAAWLDELVLGKQGERTVWVARNEAPEGTPDSYLVLHSGVEEARGPIADTLAGPVFISDILTLPAKEDETRPQIAGVLPQVKDCVPTVSSGADVFHVFGHESANVAPFRMLPESSLRYSVARFMESWTGHGEIRYGYPNWELTEPSVTHVVVTQSQTPVHLVLHNAGSAMLWHVHPAPDAGISGITVLGGTSNAVVGHADDTPLEVMNGRGLSRCDLIANAGHVRAPRTNMKAHLLDLETEAKTYADRWHINEAGEYVYDRTVPDWLKNLHRKEKFATWFQTSFNSAFDQDVIGFSRAQDLVALVGPVPDQPVPYQPLDGAAMDVGPTVTLLGFGDLRQKDEYRDLIEKTARSFAGGDLEPLRGIRMKTQ